MVITGLTRNQFASNRTWVRIPSSPPLGNNTNPDDKLEFVLFFSNEYFGIKVDLNGKKKNQPGVWSGPKAMDPKINAFHRIALVCS